MCRTTESSKSCFLLSLWNTYLTLASNRAFSMIFKPILTLMCLYHLLNMPLTLQICTALPINASVCLFSRRYLTYTLRLRKLIAFNLSECSVLIKRCRVF